MKAASSLCRCLSPELARAGAEATTELVRRHFLPLPEWDATLLMSLFRERILARLLERHAISPELVQKLLAGDTPAPPLTWVSRSLLRTGTDSRTPPPPSSQTPSP